MGEAFELGSWAGKSVDQRLVHMCAGGASRWPNMVAQYSENKCQTCSASWREREWAWLLLTHMAGGCSAQVHDPGWWGKMF